MGVFDEKQFLNDYRSNPQAAFRQLMNEYRDKIFTFCLRAIPRRQDAEDLTQEVFIRTWKGLENFRGDSSLTTWIYRIAWNVCASAIDKSGRSLKMFSLESNDDDEDTKPYEIETEDIKFKNMEDKQFLEVLFERIPESHKMILTMYYLQEMTYDEISTATGMPMGSVKATLFRAKASLKNAVLAEQSTVE
ncbi:RNA polymerase sigma factor [bacterium]|nr:RNA polymerase sigma factor [bacterium]